MPGISPVADDDSLLCTLVVPTYNAAAFLDQTIDRLNIFLEENPRWTVLFVCDGCSDNTTEILAKRLPGANPRMKAEIYTPNHGKGYAVRLGMNLARTPYRIFTDVDLAYDPDESLRLLKSLQDGFDMAVVNRCNPESRYLISPIDFPSIYKRHRMSRMFNWWLRKMLPITILDTQAGLKGLTEEAWKQLSPLMVTDGFFFDVELLARAGQLGMKVAETPVNFTYVDPTTVRMVQHGWKMIGDTLKLRRQLKYSKVRRHVKAYLHQLVRHPG